MLESARKKAGLIASEDGAYFQIIQLGAPQDALFGVYGQVPAQVRKIRSIQNLIDSCHVAQHAEYRIACSKRRVPINLAEHLGSSASQLGASDEPHLIDDREACGEVGNRASGMREDVLHVWRACESVRVVHLSDSAIGVRRKIQQIVGKSQQMRNRVR